MHACEEHHECVFRFKSTFFWFEGGVGEGEHHLIAKSVCVCTVEARGPGVGAKLLNSLTLSAISSRTLGPSVGSCLGVGDRV